TFGSPSCFAVANTSSTLLKRDGIRRSFGASFIARTRIPSAIPVAAVDVRAADGVIPRIGIAGRSGGMGETPLIVRVPNAVARVDLVEDFECSAGQWGMRLRHLRSPSSEVWRAMCTKRTLG